MRSPSLIAVAYALLAVTPAAHATERGCKCLDNWDFWGQWYHGCDVRKPRALTGWCIVDPTTCDTEAYAMSGMRTHGHMSGTVRTLPTSQAAEEHQHSWDHCSIDHEQLSADAYVIEDPLHVCPGHTWGDMVFFATNQEDPMYGKCAQLCYNPMMEFQDKDLNLMYGTTCRNEGYTEYETTTTMDKQVVHWYGKGGPAERAPGHRAETAALTHGADEGAKDEHHAPTAAPQHQCEANRVNDAIHVDGGECRQICLNPAFRNPAEKRGVQFGKTCIGQGYAIFVKEEKNLGQTIFVYRRPEEGEEDEVKAEGPQGAPSAGGAGSTGHSSGGASDPAIPPADLGSIGKCPIVSNPDMPAAEAMRLLCRNDDDVDCSALPPFLDLLADSQPEGSADRNTFKLSSQAISYICDDCSEPLRDYITSGRTEDPPPDEVRHAVCASPRCARSFEAFVVAIDNSLRSHLEKLCKLDESLGNKAMAELLSSLAYHVEQSMGLADQGLHALRAETPRKAAAVRSASTALIRRPGDGESQQLPSFMPRAVRVTSLALVAGFALFALVVSRKRTRMVVQAADDEQPPGSDLVAGKDKGKMAVTQQRWSRTARPDSGGSLAIAMPTISEEQAWLDIRSPMRRTRMGADAAGRGLVMPKPNADRGNTTSVDDYLTTAAHNELL